MSQIEQDFIDDLIRVQQKHGFYVISRAGYRRVLDGYPVGLRPIGKDEVLDCHMVDSMTVMFKTVKI
jgi:hypothetical protein